MPRGGGVADKFGNHYEALWTVDSILDVYSYRFKSITVEAIGEDGEGVEFYLVKPCGSKQYHSVKRQKTGGDWSIPNLCQPDPITSRSILGDLFSKKLKQKTSELYFVSSTGANALRELTERAQLSDQYCSFCDSISSSLELKKKFDNLKGKINHSEEHIYEMLKSLHVVLISHNELLKRLEEKIENRLIYGSCESSSAEVVRLFLAEYILGNLGRSINRDDIADFLTAKNIAPKFPVGGSALIRSVGVANEKYKELIQLDLVNGMQIVRVETQFALEAISDSKLRGAIIAAPGGFGKSCVAVQIMESLEQSGVPHLAIRIDAVQSLTTTKQFGVSLGLPDSPVAALAVLANASNCVLLIDQIDAVSWISGKNLGAWGVFQELLYEAGQYENMKLVLCCRKYDLDHDPHLGKLLGKKIECKKVLLELLSEADVANALKMAGVNHVAQGSRQAEILRVPLHLQLFLSGNPLRSFDTTGDLYEAFWNRKKQDIRDRLKRECEFETVAFELAERMSRSQVLRAPKALVSKWDQEVSAMISEHVLLEVESKQVAFFHESFFDYAYARHFYDSGESLIDMLCQSEQHLFRRAQVLRILSYARDNDFERYLEYLEAIIFSDKVRFHIKRIVASSLSKVKNPAVTELNIVRNVLFDSDISPFIVSAFRNHLGWFDLLCKQGVIQEWLESPLESRLNLALWYLRASDVQELRSEQVAGLLFRFVEISAEWSERIMDVYSWGKPYKSALSSDLFLRVIRAGLLDRYKSESFGSDVWGRFFYEAKTESPEFVIDSIVAWLDGLIIAFNENPIKSFFHSSKMSRTHQGAELVISMALVRPLYFAKRLLEKFLEIAWLCSSSASIANYNRDPWYFRDAKHAFTIDDAICQGLYGSMSVLARDEVSAFRRLVAGSFSIRVESVASLLLEAWSSNPGEYSDEIVAYLIFDQEALHGGYITWGRMHYGYVANLQKAIGAVSGICTDQQFNLLQGEVIQICECAPSEQWPLSEWQQLSLLRSLDASRASEAVVSKIAVLSASCEARQCREDEVADEGLAAVLSPISEATAINMSDEQWIAALIEYDSSDERRLVGGIRELSAVLSACTRKDRIRFANLALMIPDEVHSHYLCSILNGMTSRFVSMSVEEKLVDDAEIDGLSMETFVGVLRKAHSTPGKKCGGAICECVGRLSARPLSAELLEMVGYYAVNDEDPIEEVWRLKSGDQFYHDGDPFCHGINTVRGMAAMAIDRLLNADGNRLSVLSPALESLVHDQSASVRSCSIAACCSLLKYEPEQAMRYFKIACFGCEEIWATQPFVRFVRYAKNGHYSQLHSVLMEALHCQVADAVRCAAREICLADLLGIAEDGVAVEVRLGSDVMREAAAGIYARNINDAIYGKRCAQLLSTFFDDECVEVRRTVAGAFHHLSLKQLEGLADVVELFVLSKSFENGAEYLLMSIEESRVMLPSIVLKAARRVLEFIGVEGTHIAYFGSIVASTISRLVVRLYDQTSEENVKIECLDLIDEMERKGYLGIGDALSELDRAL